MKRLNLDKIPAGYQIVKVLDRVRDGSLVMKYLVYPDDVKLEDVVNDFAKGKAKVFFTESAY